MHTKPTARELREFWAAHTGPSYTCTDCGKVDDSHRVQPQHPYYADGRDDVALCLDCMSRRRKAQLDAMPRCECCSRRATVKTMGVLLCGRHWNNAQSEHHRLQANNPFALFMAFDYNRVAIIMMAQNKRGE